jgi:hypothetical protein
LSHEQKFDLTACRKPLATEASWNNFTVVENEEIPLTKKLSNVGKPLVLNIPALSVEH